MQVTESHAKVVHNLGKDFAIATSETKRTFDVTFQTLEKFQVLQT